MKNVISQDEFLPDYGRTEKNYLQFGKSITINRGIYPFRVKYLPFYEQMAIQLTNLLKKLTNKKFMNYFIFYFRTTSGERQGPMRIEKRYIVGLDLEQLKTVDRLITFKTDVYRGEFLKLHKGGYAYGRFSMHNKLGLSNSADIWFRWKSNIPDYEYIEPDDELNLTKEDITFEICEQVPEEYIMRFYAKTASEYDCNEWKTIINDDCYYPKKRSKKRNDFICEISEKCEYPDTAFTLYFNQEITESLKEQVVSEFVDFQEDWDSKHLYGIHDILLADDLDELYDDDTLEELKKSNAIRVFVDFGNSDYKIIKSLVKWLKSTELKIVKVFIE